MALITCSVLQLELKTFLIIVKLVFIKVLNFLLVATEVLKEFEAYHSNNFYLILSEYAIKIYLFYIQRLSWFQK